MKIGMFLRVSALTICSIFTFTTLGNSAPSVAFDFNAGYSTASRLSESRFNESTAQDMMPDVLSRVQSHINDNILSKMDKSQAQVKAEEVVTDFFERDAEGKTVRIRQLEERGIDERVLDEDYMYDLVAVDGRLVVKDRETLVVNDVEVEEGGTKRRFKLFMVDKAIALTELAGQILYSLAFFMSNATSKKNSIFYNMVTIKTFLRIDCFFQSILLSVASRLNKQDYRSFWYKKSDLLYQQDVIREKIEWATSRDQLDLLESNDASALLLEPGTFLVHPKYAFSRTRLASIIEHESIECMMQVKFFEDEKGYASTRDLILSDEDISNAYGRLIPINNTYLWQKLMSHPNARFNDMVAKFFELKRLKEKEISIPEECEDFYLALEPAVAGMKKSFFDESFDNRAERETRIKTAYKKGLRFWNNAYPDNPGRGRKARRHLEFLSLIDSEEYLQYAQLSFQDKSTSLNIKQAALDAILRIGGKDVLTRLADLMDESLTVELQKMLIDVIATIDTEEADKKLKSFLYLSDVSAEIIDCTALKLRARVDDIDLVFAHYLLGLGKNFEVKLSDVEQTRVNIKVFKEVMIDEDFKCLIMPLALVKALCRIPGKQSERILALVAAKHLHFEQSETAFKELARRGVCTPRLVVKKYLNDLNGGVEKVRAMYNLRLFPSHAMELIREKQLDGEYLSDKEIALLSEIDDSRSKALLLYEYAKFPTSYIKKNVNSSNILKTWKEKITSFFLGSCLFNHTDKNQGTYAGIFAIGVVMITMSISAYVTNFSYWSLAYGFTSGGISVFIWLNIVPVIRKLYERKIRKINFTAEKKRTPVTPENVIFAKDVSDIALLENNDAKALLLKNGKILLNSELRYDYAGQRLNLHHENIEALMQIMKKEHFLRYNSMRYQVLNNDTLSDKYFALFPEGADYLREKMRTQYDARLNDLVAKMYELQLKKELKLELGEQEKEFQSLFNQVDGYVKNSLGINLMDERKVSKRVNEARKQGFKFWNNANVSDDLLNKNEVYKNVLATVEGEDDIELAKQLFLSATKKATCKNIIKKIISILGDESNPVLADLFDASKEINKKILIVESLGNIKNDESYAFLSSLIKAGIDVEIRNQAYVSLRQIDCAFNAMKYKKAVVDLNDGYNHKQAIDLLRQIQAADPAFIREKVDEKLDRRSLSAGEVDVIETFLIKDAESFLKRAVISEDKKTRDKAFELVKELFTVSDRLASEKFILDLQEKRNEDSHNAKGELISLGVNALPAIDKELESVRFFKSEFYEILEEGEDHRVVKIIIKNLFDHHDVDTNAVDSLTKLRKKNPKLFSIKEKLIHSLAWLHLKVNDKDSWGYTIFHSAMLLYLVASLYLPFLGMTTPFLLIAYLILKFPFVFSLGISKTPGLIAKNIDFSDINDTDEYQYTDFVSIVASQQENITSKKGDDFVIKDGDDVSPDQWEDKLAMDLIKNGNASEQDLKLLVLNKDIAVRDKALQILRDKYSITKSLLAQKYVLDLMGAQLPIDIASFDGLVELGIYSLPAIEKAVKFDGWHDYALISRILQRIEDKRSVRLLTKMMIFSGNDYLSSFKVLSDFKRKNPELFSWQDKLFFTLYKARYILYEKIDFSFLSVSFLYLAPVFGLVMLKALSVIFAVGLFLNLLPALISRGLFINEEIGMTRYYNIDSSEEVDFNVNGRFGDVNSIGSIDSKELADKYLMEKTKRDVNPISDDRLNELMGSIDPAFEQQTLEALTLSSDDMIRDTAFRVLINKFNVTNETVIRKYLKDLEREFEVEVAKGMLLFFEDMILPYVCENIEKKDTYNEHLVYLLCRLDDARAQNLLELMVLNEADVSTDIQREFHRLSKSVKGRKQRILFDGALILSNAGMFIRLSLAFNAGLLINNWAQAFCYAFIIGFLFYKDTYTSFFVPFTTKKSEIDFSDIKGGHDMFVFKKLTKGSLKESDASNLDKSQPKDDETPESGAVEDASSYRSLLEHNKGGLSSQQVELVQENIAQARELLQGFLQGSIDLDDVEMVGEQGLGNSEMGYVYNDRIHLSYASALRKETYAMDYIHELSHLIIDKDQFKTEAEQDLVASVIQMRFMRVLCDHLDRNSIVGNSSSFESLVNYLIEKGNYKDSSRKAVLNLLNAFTKTGLNSVSAQIEALRELVEYRREEKVILDSESVEDEIRRIEKSIYKETIDIDETLQSIGNRAFRKTRDAIVDNAVAVKGKQIVILDGKQTDDPAYLHSLVYNMDREVYTYYEGQLWKLNISKDAVLEVEPVAVGSLDEAADYVRSNNTQAEISVVSDSKDRLLEVRTENVMLFSTEKAGKRAKELRLEDLPIAMFMTAIAFGMDEKGAAAGSGKTQLLNKKIIHKAGTIFELNPEYIAVMKDGLEDTLSKLYEGIKAALIQSASSRRIESAA